MNYEICWEIDESDTNLDTNGQAAFVPGVTHFQRMDGKLGHRLPHRVQSKPTHLKRQERKKPTTAKSQQMSSTGQEHASMEDQVSLRHLRPEDKKRIANLIKQLAKVGEEKQVALQQLKVERKQFEVKYVDLESQMKTLNSERESTQQQYLQCQRLLAECQERLASEQNQHTKLLKFAQKGLRSDEKFSGGVNGDQRMSLHGRPSAVQDEFQPQLQSTGRLKRGHDHQTNRPGNDPEVTSGQEQTTKLRSSYHNDAYSNHGTIDPIPAVYRHKVPNGQEFGQVGQTQRNKVPPRGREDVGHVSERRELPHLSPAVFSPDEFHPLPEELMTSKSLSALGNVEDEFCSIVEKNQDRMEPHRHYSGRHPTNDHGVIINGELTDAVSKMHHLRNDTMQQVFTRQNANQTFSNRFQTDLSHHRVQGCPENTAHLSRMDEQTKAPEHGWKSTPEMLVERKRLLERQKEALRKEQDWLQQQLRNQEELLYQKQLELEAHRRSLLEGNSPQAGQKGVTSIPHRGENPHFQDFHSDSRHNLDHDVSLTAHIDPGFERLQGRGRMGGPINGGNLSHHGGLDGDRTSVLGMRGGEDSHISVGQIQGSVTLHSDSHRKENKTSKPDRASNATVDVATSALIVSHLHPERRVLRASPAIHHPGSGLSRESSVDALSSDEFVTSPEKRPVGNSARVTDFHILEHLIEDLNSVPSDSSESNNRPFTHPATPIESHPRRRRTAPLKQTAQVSSDWSRIPPATLSSRLYGSEIVESSDEEEESKMLDDIFFVN
ncbi:uncharacterized protein [Apostichopus japonicus]|uniref:uncharacterized protein n=1 Tax=Stichopus japonicus TaxID=307972 RepID=UPI003AB3C2C6